MIQFAFPIAYLPFWLGVGVFLMALTYAGLRVLEARREKRLDRFVESGLAQRLLAAYDLRARRPLYWLTLVGTLFLLIALAQPHWGDAWMPVTRTSRDILVVLDVSLSMSAENPPPSRLERARQKIESLLERCPADRVGLVVFAGEAVMMCPLTLDHGYFRAILDAINTDTLSVEGSDLAGALQQALEVFEEDARYFGDNERNNRAMILISDGEETAGEAVATAAEIGKYATIFALGVGDPDGAVITFPAWMRKYVRMADERLTHVSKLDEETLSRIALDGGGAYVRITPDNADVNFIHQELEHIRARTADDTVRYRLVNRYRWPLTAAWLCFAAEGAWLSVLPWLRRRRLKLEEGRVHG
ncbi:MAG TPA: VWA domain-containing protein [Candidatus Hydrogenedentes bacterium]|nr:VWA domain-containing protein [Candidatus Hydrogenedentota bacterium]